jgi:putative flippase GtrA
MRALRHLEYIAGIQRSALSAASAPSRVDGRGALAGLWGVRWRLATFAVNGVIVFAAGLALQFALIKFLHLSHVVSYIIQTMFSVQLNFALSRLLTWRDRAVSFAGALARFNVQQLAAAALAMALYAGLDRLGMHFPVSNIVVTALLAPVTFIVGHRWSMAERLGRPDRHGQHYAMQLRRPGRYCQSLQPRVTSVWREINCNKTPHNVRVNNRRQPSGHGYGSCAYVGINTL